MRTSLFTRAVMIVFLSAVAHAQQTVSIGVLGLFHSHEMVLEQDGGQVVAVSASSEALVLNGEPGHRRVIFEAVGDRVTAGGYSALQWKAATREGSPVAFQLAVPGKLRRRYHGLLTIEARQGELVAIVAMDREEAVASIVAAEMNAQAPLEALKAQAVVTRSFLAAGARHREFDFCDTTHCQFLRSPPSVDSAVMRAVEATRGLVLSYRQKTIAAMYSSRCGGQTHSLREAGMDPGESYPYFPVECRYCRRYATRWKSRLDGGTNLTAGNERVRIAQARLWGWSAMPGSDFKAKRDGESWLIEGSSVGHGVGMCQFGATGMAANGADFRSILEHYYPNSELVVLR
jgi:hypothetical protein